MAYLGAGDGAMPPSPGTWPNFVMTVFLHFTEFVLPEPKKFRHSLADKLQLFCHPDEGLGSRTPLGDFHPQTPSPFRSF